MSDEIGNPYAAPQAELQPLESRKHFAGRAMLRAWLIVFLVNLPMPILFGIHLCNGSGHVAMLAMIVLMLIISSWLVVAKPWFGNRLIDGGVVVAVSQGLPVLHLALAAVGTNFVEAVGLYTPPPPLPPGYDYMDVQSNSLGLNQYSPAAMMFLTAFVGLGLMLFALILGSLPILQYRSEIQDDE